MAEPDIGAVGGIATSVRKRVSLHVMGIYAAAVVAGIVIGCIAVFMHVGEPDKPTLSGPIEAGQEKIIPISWPTPTGVNRPQTVYVDVAIAERVADEIAIVFELVDPETKTRLPLGRFENPDGHHDNKLIYAEYDFNLDPQLATMRGSIRQIKANVVDLVVRVERLSGTKMGYVYVMNAGSIRPLKQDEQVHLLGPDGKTSHR
jgi:hypothetical protein